MENKPLRIDSMTTPEGIVGEIVRLEAQATELIAGAKQLQAQADFYRGMVQKKLEKMKLKSVKHSSGYTATLVEKTKISIKDEDILVQSLLSNNLQNLTEVVPEHVAVRDTEFKKWLKDSNAIDIVKGVEVEKSSHLMIIKPK